MSAYSVRYFRECNLEDPFFDSLREDYPGFNDWFSKKSESDETAYVSIEEDKIQAFLYIKKEECESVGILPALPRMKIGTIKVCETGIRLGEGAIGIALWEWQKSDLSQIYVTVFEKHNSLIKILEDFGFVNGGMKGDELVLYKDKHNLSYKSPKSSFPYLNPDFKRGGYLPLNAQYHDLMFQYSELRNVKNSAEETALAASNGITKTYIATPNSYLDYVPGDVIFAYRRAEEGVIKKYHSAVTSYCTVAECVCVKRQNRILIPYDKYLEIAGNKTVLSPSELRERYNSRNVYILVLIYNGFFGKGNNVNYQTLKDNSLFEGHPYANKLSRNDVIKILRMGEADVQNIIID